MMRTVKGFAVCWVDHKNEIHPSHDDGGFYQEVFATRMAAVEREQELLDTVGGVYEVVKAIVILERDN